jgi:hypothetical protein
LIGAQPAYLAPGEPQFGPEQAATAHAHAETAGHDDSGRPPQEAGAVPRFAGHWAADQVIVGELYAQVLAVQTSRLSSFRTIFDRKDRLWDSLSPAFDELKSYTERHFRLTARTHLFLGADLASIPFREYVVPFAPKRLAAVSLAIRPLQRSERGSIGIEIVSSQQRVLARAVVRVAAVCQDVPTRFQIGPPIEDLDSPWRLRVFAKDVCAPVAIWELIRYSGLSSVKEYLPFALFQEYGL